MGYFDWHEQPGYFRDVTRHFAADAELLDVGCGTGWLAEHFADYTGIDGSPDAVAAAQAQGPQRACWATSTSRCRSRDASFDGVVLKDLLEHVADPVAVVREVAARAAPRRPRVRLLARRPALGLGRLHAPPPVHPQGFRLLFADQGFEVEQRRLRVGDARDQRSSRRGRRRNRRPRAAALRAWLPFVRRNVWLVARR